MTRDVEWSGTDLPDECKELSSPYQLPSLGPSISMVKRSVYGDDEDSFPVTDNTHVGKWREHSNSSDAFIPLAIVGDNLTKKAYYEQLDQYKVETLVLNSAWIFLETQNRKDNPRGIVIKTPCSKYSSNEMQSTASLHSALIDHHIRNVRGITSNKYVSASNEYITKNVGYVSNSHALKSTEFDVNDASVMQGYNGPDISLLGVRTSYPFSENSHVSQIVRKRSQNRKELHPINDVSSSTVSKVRKLHLVKRAAKDDGHTSASGAFGNTLSSMDLSSDSVVEAFSLTPLLSSNDLHHTPIVESSAYDNFLNLNLPLSYFAAVSVSEDNLLMPLFSYFDSTSPFISTQSTVHLASDSYTDTVSVYEENVSLTPIASKLSNFLSSAVEGGSLTNVIVLSPSFYPTEFLDSVVEDSSSVSVMPLSSFIYSALTLTTSSGDSSVTLRMPLSSDSYFVSVPVLKDSLITPLILLNSNSFFTAFAQDITLPSLMPVSSVLNFSMLSTLAEDDSSAFLTVPLPYEFSEVSSSFVEYSLSNPVISSSFYSTAVSAVFVEDESSALVEDYFVKDVICSPSSVSSAEVLASVIDNSLIIPTVSFSDLYSTAVPASFLGKSFTPALPNFSDFFSFVISESVVKELYTPVIGLSSGMHVTGFSEVLNVAPTFCVGENCATPVITASHDLYSTYAAVSVLRDSSSFPRMPLASNLFPTSVSDIGIEDSFVSYKVTSSSFYPTSVSVYVAEDSFPISEMYLSPTLGYTDLPKASMVKDGSLINSATSLVSSFLQDFEMDLQDGSYTENTSLQVEFATVHEYTQSANSGPSYSLHPSFESRYDVYTVAAGSNTLDILERGQFSKMLNSAFGASVSSSKRESYGGFVTKSHDVNDSYLEESRSKTLVNNVRSVLQFSEGVLENTLAYDGKLVSSESISKSHFRENKSSLIKGSLPPATASSGMKSGAFYLHNQFSYVQSRYPFTAALYGNEIATVITCISCTFILKTSMKIISSTVLMQPSPVLVTEQCPLDMSNLVFDSDALDVSATIQSYFLERETMSVSPLLLSSVYMEDILHSVSYFQTDKVSDAETFIHEAAASSTKYNLVHQEATGDIENFSNVSSAPVSELLKNIVDYIQAFRAFASSNFNLRGEYDYVVDKKIEDIVNLNLRFLWNLRFKLNSVMSNSSYLTQCLQSIEFGQRLSHNYVISPETVYMLKSVKDYPWLKEMVDIIIIKQKKSLDQLISQEEQVRLKSWTETIQNAPPPPPPPPSVPRFTIEMMSEKLKNISDLRKTLLRITGNENENISRRVREIGNFAVDLDKTSKLLREYFKPLAEGIAIQFSSNSYIQTLTDYSTLRNHYYAMPFEERKAFTEIIEGTDTLLEIALSKISKSRTALKEKLRYIVEDDYEKEISAENCTVNWRENYNGSCEHQVYMNMSSLLYNLERKLLQSLPIIMSFTVDYLENISSSEIDSYYNVLRALENDSLGFCENDNYSNIEFILSSDMYDNFIEDQFGRVSLDTLEKWFFILQTIPVVSLRMINMTGEYKCSNNLLDAVTDFSTIPSLAYDIQNYLKELNSTRARICDSCLVLEKNSALKAYVTDQIDNLTLTVRDIFSGFILSNHFNNEIDLKQQVRTMKVTLDFFEVVGPCFSSVLSVKLSILQVLLENGISKIKYISECTENRKCFENVTDQAVSSRCESTLEINDSSNVIVNDRDTEQLKVLLNFTRKVLIGNPLNKDNVRKSSLPNSEEMSVTAGIVLKTFNSIIRLLNNQTVELDLDALDELLQQHLSLMEEAEGHIDYLSAEAVVKLLMIYGDSQNGRAAVVEKLLADELKNIYSGEQSRFILPRHYMEHDSKDHVKFYNSWVVGKVAGYHLKNFSELSVPLILGPRESYDFIGKFFFIASLLTL